MTHSARQHGAFTLIELLVVIGVASILMSIGVGAYINMNKDLAWHSAVTTVTSLLQACRNSATTDRTSTSLVFVTEPDSSGMYVCKEAYALTMRRVGTWNFEEVTKDGVTSTSAAIVGAAGQTANGAELDESPVVDGKYGHALQFTRWTIDETEAATVTEHKPAVTCQKPLLVYDLREGMRISAWVRPEMPPATVDRTTEIIYPIVTKPFHAGAANPDPVAQDPVYALKLVLQSGEDLFRLVGSIRTDGTGLQPYETFSVPMIRPGAWVHVSMLYTSTDGSAIQLFVNDEPLTEAGGVQILPAGQTPSSGLLPGERCVIRRSAEPLAIGFDGAQSFHGAIDEVTIDAITSSDRTSLPANVLLAFSGGWNVLSVTESTSSGPRITEEFRVGFDRSGRLVVGAGGKLPLVAVCSAGSPMATLIGVDRSGAIDTWDTSKAMLNGEAAKWLEAE